MPRLKFDCPVCGAKAVVLRDKPVEAACKRCGKTWPYVSRQRRHVGRRGETRRTHTDLYVGDDSFTYLLASW